MLFHGKAAILSAVLGVCGITAAAVGLPAASKNASLQAERVIEDPHSGRRWVLAKDPEHPGGPGKLVEQRPGTAAKSSGAVKDIPVIRAGDRVLVEENTRAARGLFDAIALSSAKQGAKLRVRLSIGGRVVRAIAAGPGRAVLAGADEVRQ